MKIEELWVYPVKSLRGVAIESAKLTKYGFPYDRQYCMLQVNDDNGDITYKNMSVANMNDMVRYFPSIDYDKKTMTITFHPLDGGEPKKSMEMPLEPDISDMEPIDIMMHKSPTKAYKMAPEYNEWLSSCFGYDTVLAYIGSNRREVRMSALGYKSFNPEGNDTNTASSWLSSITSAASKASGMILGGGTEKPSEIMFADVAPYLIVSSKSMDDVHTRLPEGEEFDISKFRPNIIVSGAEKPWDEDFWGELTISGKTKVECEHNCGRCKSINIDYETGAQGTGDAGKMLKYLSRDRRVDKGTKWSPIFGRYAFLPAECEGDEIKVGDEVSVSRVNEEHTAFDWKGLSTLPGGGRD